MSSGQRFLYRVGIAAVAALGLAAATGAPWACSEEEVVDSSYLRIELVPDDGQGSAPGAARVVVKVGDKLFDGSVVSKLEQLRTRSFEKTEAAIRGSLDGNCFEHIPILSYAAKFAAHPFIGYSSLNRNNGSLSVPREHPTAVWLATGRHCHRGGSHSLRGLACQWRRLSH